MKVSPVAASSPFKQAMLSPEECYILDNGVDKNIFVWKGTSSLIIAFWFPPRIFFSPAQIREKLDGKCLFAISWASKLNTWEAAVLPLIQSNIFFYSHLNCYSESHQIYSHLFWNQCLSLPEVSEDILRPCSDLVLTSVLRDLTTRGQLWVRPFYTFNCLLNGAAHLWSDLVSLLYVKIIMWEICFWKPQYVVFTQSEFTNDFNLESGQSGRVFI